jgi:hypothetical protein
MQLVEQRPDFPPDQHAVIIIAMREGFDARIDEASRFAAMLPDHLKGTGPEMMLVIHSANIYRDFLLSYIEQIRNICLLKRSRP